MKEKTPPLDGLLPLQGSLDKSFSFLHSPFRVFQITLFFSTEYDNGQI